MALSDHGMKQQLDDALSTIEDVLGNLRPFLMGKTSNPPPFLGRGFNPLWMQWGTHPLLDSRGPRCRPCGPND